MPHCRRLAPHLTVRARSLALDRDGIRMATRSAMMATTTSNSMRVNALLLVALDIVIILIFHSLQAEKLCAIFGVAHQRESTENKDCKRYRDFVQNTHSKN